jgi:hypothetical protein
MMHPVVTGDLLCFGAYYPIMKPTQRRMHRPVIAYGFGRVGQGCNGVRVNAVHMVPPANDDR